MKTDSKKNKGKSDMISDKFVFPGLRQETLGSLDLCR